MVKNILKKISEKVFGSEAPEATAPKAESDSAKVHSSRSSAPAQKRPPRSRDSRSDRNNRNERSEGRPRQQETKPWSLDQFVVAPEAGKSRFHDFNIHESIMHAVHDLEFRYCTPVQAEVLEPAMKGNDVMAQAQTGTGKTAAFLISTFDRFLRAEHECWSSRRRESW